MAKVYDTATDLITFARSSSGTALRRVGYGDELVTNGGFDTDTDWDLLRMYISGGTLNFGSEWGANRARSTLNVVAGKTYSSTITCNADGSGGNLVIYVNGVQQDFFPTIPSDTTQAETIVFRATQSGPIELRATGTGAVNNSWDNFSVKEVIFDRATDDLVLFNHPDDIPRIEYAADGSLKGLLIEEQRTNLVTYSEDFSNAEWTATQSGLDSISVSSETTPDGLTNAYEITEDNTATVHYFQDGVSGLSATSYTLSLFARQGSGTRYLQLRTGGAGIFANFDLSTGNVVDSGGAYILQANIEDFGNNWYRCSVAGDFAVAPSSYQIILSNSTGAAPSYTGDGTSSILIYGAQLEQGSFATSYIPTSGSQSTRSPDLASIPVSAFGYNQSAGAVVAEYVLNNTAFSATRTLVQLDNGTTSNRLALQVSTTTGRSRVFMAAAGVTQDNVGSEDVLEGVANKTAIAFVENSTGISTNGSAAENGDGTSVVPSITTLRLGLHSNGNFPLNGHIKSLSYFPRRLTDAQLQELTA